MKVGPGEAPRDVCLATALLLAGCSDSPKDDNEPADPNDAQAASAEVISKFAAGWVKAWAPDGKPDEAAALTDAPAFGPQLDGIDSPWSPRRRRSPRRASRPPTTTPAPRTLRRAVARIGTMKWTSKATAVKVEDAWKIKATGDVIYPGLADTNTLKRTCTLPERASIVDRTGRPLTVNRPVVLVGVESGTKATAATYAAFTKWLDVNGANLRKRAVAAPPAQFIEAITLRQRSGPRCGPSSTRCPA